MKRSPIEDKIAGEFGGKGAVLLAAVLGMAFIGVMIWQQSARPIPSSIIPTDAILGCYKADGWPTLRLERNRLVFEQPIPFVSRYTYRRNNIGAALELTKTYAVQTGDNGREAINGSFAYIRAFRFSPGLNKYLPTQQTTPAPAFQLFDGDVSIMYHKAECGPAL